MSIEVGDRPPGIDGCWASWQEQDVDVVARTSYETGNMRTRRRFTGLNRQVNATVTLKSDLYDAFQTWFRINQKQGAAGTLVKTPYGTEEVFQFVGPPVIQFIDPNAFRATVIMFQGSDF